MLKLAVIGNPIAHSLSPLIWQTFAADLGLTLQYDKLFSEIDTFEHNVTEFFASGGLALNVTAPFKARAFAYANQHNHHSVGCQTANLLINKNGVIVADNTDGVGLIDDFRYQGVNLSGKNILIIGNGSVIHSVLSSLELEAPTRIDLLMRNWDNLAAFENRSALLAAYDEDVVYDVIINTTPSTPENDLFAKIRHIATDAIAYDMIYTAKQTLFLHAMQDLNQQVKQSNGIGMLIQQAKVGFNILFNQMPQVAHLYPLLQAKFND